LCPQFKGVIHAFSHKIESVDDNMPTLLRLSAKWLEGFRHPMLESLRLSQLALPLHQHTPAQLFMFNMITPVSEHI
jgi:hypothetical protein